MIRQLLDYWSSGAMYVLEAFVELMNILTYLFILLFGVVYSLLIVASILAALLLPILAVLLLIKAL